MGFNSIKEIKKFIDIDVFAMLDKIFSTEQVQDRMILLNQDQLQQGKDALGQEINTIGGNPYRPLTIIIRQEAFLPIDKVTLEFSGEFYKTFKVRIVQEGYEITADFQKGSDSILDNFDSKFDFLGLDEKNAVQFVLGYVRPALEKMIRKELRL